MTIFRRIILRTARTRPSVPQTLNPPPRACSRDLPNPRLLCHRCCEQPYHSSAYEIEVVKAVPSRGGAGGLYRMYPAVLAGLIGLGGLEVAYADAEEAASKQGLPADAPANNVEEIAKKQRQEIEDLLKSKGIQRGSYPNFSVSVKGQKVAIKFQIPPACEASQVIANIASNLGLKVEEHGGGSDISLRAWDSGVAWQLMLMHPEKQKETEGDQGELKDVNEHDRDLHILVFRSVITSTEKAEIEFMKQGSLSPKELDALVSALQLAGTKKSLIHEKKSTTERRVREDSAQTSSIEKLITSLESMGVRVYGVDEPNMSSTSKDISWDNLAGYDLQKGQIEDTILLALLSPETYDEIAHGTRRKFESNKPRAVLFEGPPGTGKTSSARVIANQAIDGFEQDKKVVVIAATNRKQDLDPALISRFDSIIPFGLPDHQNRKEIAAEYAKHLTETELDELATVTEEMSGRDIRDVNKQRGRGHQS